MPAFLHNIRTRWEPISPSRSKVVVQRLKFHFVANKLISFTFQKLIVESKALQVQKKHGPSHLTLIQESWKQRYEPAFQEYVQHALNNYASSCSSGRLSGTSQLI